MKDKQQKRVLVLVAATIAIAIPGAGIFALNASKQASDPPARIQNPFIHKQ